MPTSTKKPIPIPFNMGLVSEFDDEWVAME